MTTTVPRPTEPPAVPSSGQGALRGLGAIALPGLLTRSTDAVLASPRFWLLAFGHLVMFGWIYWSAYLLRFDFAVPANYVDIFWISLPWLGIFAFHYWETAKQAWYDLGQQFLSLINPGRIEALNRDRESLQQQLGALAEDYRQLQSTSSSETDDR